MSEISYGSATCMLTPKQRERFWSYVDQSGGPHACWPWTRAVNGRGYGYFAGRLGFESATLGAHKWAFMLANGPVDEGFVICHSCDNPPCCNPAHLWVGTSKENMRDASIKGRLRSRGRKITNETAAEVRHRFTDDRASINELTKEFDLSRTAVLFILLGRTYADAPGPTHSPTELRRKIKEQRSYPAQSSHCIRGHEFDGTTRQNGRMRKTCSACEKERRRIRALRVSPSAHSG